MSRSQPADQPFWARKFLQGEEADEELDPGLLSMDKVPIVRCRGDIIEHVSRGEGRGLLVTEKLLASYPDARKDVIALIEQGAVRSILRQQTVIRGGKHRPQPEHPIDQVLFLPFGQDINVIDADIRDAYHEIKRVQAGDVHMAMSVTSKPELIKSVRRESNRKRKVRNTHMHDVET